MDISSDPGAALILRQGADQTLVSLGAIKRQAQADSDLVAMVTDSVKAASTSPNRGRTVDTSA